MSLKKIIEETHSYVNQLRKEKGLPPVHFKKVPNYIESDAIFLEYTFKGEPMRIEVEKTQDTADLGMAPYCQCPDCQGAISNGASENAKRVTRNAAIGQWNKYAYGHRPSKEKTTSSLDTEDILAIKVISKKEYEERKKKKVIVDERILNILKQVSNGEQDEVTCITPPVDKKRAIAIELRRGIKHYYADVKIKVRKDHIALTRI